MWEAVYVKENGAVMRGEPACSSQEGGAHTTSTAPLTNGDCASSTHYRPIPNPGAWPHGPPPHLVCLLEVEPQRPVAVLLRLLKPEDLEARHGAAEWAWGWGGCRYQPKLN